MNAFPEHISETAKRLLAERKKFHITFSENHGAWQVRSVDELKDVRYQGSLENCELWVESVSLAAALSKRKA